MEPASLTIDGFGPLPVVRPTSITELGETVRRAAADGQAIYPFGGQTQLDLGNPPTKSGIAIDLRGLDQVIDFPARDMTITVQAGITVAKLQRLLATENLRLPIDVPQPEQATLGGILATNVSGPRRLGYGTLRDYVIGISAVNDEGDEFKAGGRVVKNVAGYDLCKLLVGSLGTLGVITQVTLKLRPLAEETALVILGGEGDGLAALLDQIHASRTRPVCVELLNQPAMEGMSRVASISWPAARWAVVVGYEGNADAVNWQVQQLVKEMGGTHSVDARVGASAHALWQALIGWQVAARPKHVVKVVTVPSQVVDVCVLPADDMIHAHAGSGIIYRLRHTDPPFVESSISFLHPQGSVLVLKRPHESGLLAWGNASPNNAWLMHRVKKQFDPRSVFNPGRYVDGI